MTCCACCDSSVRCKLSRYLLEFVLVSKVILVRGQHYSQLGILVYSLERALIDLYSQSIISDSFRRIHYMKPASRVFDMNHMDLDSAFSNLSTS